jgi:DNA processing protein
MRELIIKAAIKYEGSYEKIANAIKNHEHIVSDQGVEDAITILDKGYPMALKQLRYPPFVLFYKGNPDLLNLPAISIIGSRHA